MTEFFRSDHPQAVFGRSQGVSFSALSMNYPFGIIDRLSGIVYLDWTDNAWYRFVSWQRTYDNWIIYILGFWNPGAIHFYQTQAASNTFAGTGNQLMVVVNH